MLVLLGTDGERVRRAAVGRPAAAGLGRFARPWPTRSAARWRRRIGGWEVISWALVFSPRRAMLLPACSPGRATGTRSASAWAGFLYVSVFSMFLGFFAWNKGLALGGIARLARSNCCSRSWRSLPLPSCSARRWAGWRSAFACLVVGIVALGWRMRVARY